MKVTRRKRSIILIGGAAILLGIISILLLAPTFSRQAFLEKGISKRKADLEEMRALNLEWDRIKRAKALAEGMLERRGKPFALLSHLETVSKELEIEKRIQHMKPVPLSEEPTMMKAEAVEISLNDITTDELVSLLFQIECSEKLLMIKRSSIQRSGEPGSGLLKISLQIHTYATPQSSSVQDFTTNWVSRDK